MVWNWTSNCHCQSKWANFGQKLGSPAKTSILNEKSSEINGSRISLKISQYYRTFCRTLGHPGQFLTVTDQLSYYLIICYHWLAVPNGPIRISIANELRLKDQFSVTLFHHFFQNIGNWWRHQFYDVTDLYLFIYFRKTKNGTTRKQQRIPYHSHSMGSSTGKFSYDVINS